MTISNPSQRFLLFSIICCFLSVITTLGIHSNLFALGDLTFDDRIRLFDNSKYLVNRFWVILHCLFVLVAMLGFLLIQFKKSPGFAVLGFIFFVVFSFTEIFRQMFVLFYMNNLRRSYLANEDEITRQIIQTNLEHAGLVGYALFGLFIVAFSLGNLFYGISLLGEKKWDKILAYLLIIWGVGNLVAFGNEFWQNEPTSHFVEYFSIIYQPIMRFIIGIWLFSKLKGVV